MACRLRSGGGATGVGYQDWWKMQRIKHGSINQDMAKGVRATTYKDQAMNPPIEVVLKTLSKPSYFPVNHMQKGWRKFLTRRTIFLVAITSTRRASKLHAIQHCVDFTGTDVSLCLDQGQQRMG